MKDFESTLLNIRGLFELDSDGSDMDKNYYIPKYQRNYTWNSFHIERLIEDISEVVINKKDDQFLPYFLGGIVLSRESLEDNDITKKSFEVVDGQQRLTTLMIFLSYFLFELKRIDRDYNSMSEIIENIKKKINGLIYSTIEDYINYTTIKRINVQRSDELNNAFKYLIEKLCEGENIEIIKSKLQEMKYEINFPENIENLIDIIDKLNELIGSFSDTFLIDFIKQVLEHTKIVVTRTNDIETAFLVFEKLNDRGRELNVEDLLKNFLFQKSTKKEYDNLSEDWIDLLLLIKSINGRRAKIEPREFLEHYLFAYGVEFQRNRTSIFSNLKTLRKEEENNSTAFIEKLEDFAHEYRILKQDKIIQNNLDLINFKLGYVLLLSMYKNLSYTTYTNNKYKILTSVFKLGFINILTGNSKLLSNLIPILCLEIKKNKISNIDEELIIFKFEDKINEYIYKLEKQFQETLISTNMYRKKKISEYLIKLIYIFENKEVKNIQLFKILNDSTRTIFTPEISEIEFQVYSNRLGNLDIIESAITKWSIKDISSKGEHYSSVLLKLFFDKKLTSEILIKVLD